MTIDQSRSDMSEPGAKSANGSTHPPLVSRRDWAMTLGSGGSRFVPKRRIEGGDAKHRVRANAWTYTQPNWCLQEELDLGVCDSRPSRQERYRASQHMVRSGPPVLRACLNGGYSYASPATGQVAPWGSMTNLRPQAVRRYPDKFAIRVRKGTDPCVTDALVELILDDSESFDLGACDSAPGRQNQTLHTSSQSLPFLMSADGLCHTGPSVGESRGIQKGVSISSSHITSIGPASRREMHYRAGKDEMPQRTPNINTMNHRMAELQIWVYAHLRADGEFSPEDEAIANELNEIYWMAESIRQDMLDGFSLMLHGELVPHRQRARAELQRDRTQAMQVAA